MGWEWVSRVNGKWKLKWMDVDGKLQQPYNITTIVEQPSAPASPNGALHRPDWVPRTPIYGNVPGEPIPAEGDTRPKPPTQPPVQVPGTNPGSDKPPPGKG